MNWEDEGYLLSKKKFRENAVIISAFTQKYGKITGIVYGGTSRKIKNYLQIGNKFHVNYISKNDNKTGYFKVEILKAFSPFFFEDKQKLLCLNCSMKLIKILSVESEANSKIYFLLDHFFEILISNNWINKYIFWELDLFSLIGYDLDLKKIVKSEIVNDKKQYFVESKSQKKYVPDFLVELNINEGNVRNLIDGLMIVGDYLEKSILKPNNIIYPIDRTNFINSLK